MTAIDATDAFSRRPLSRAFRPFTGPVPSRVVGPRVAKGRAPPWLRALRQPTLILMGRDDPLVPVANGHIMVRLIPNSRLEVIDDGHLFVVTRPFETAQRIERFLAH